jgi:hypothetical protein
MTPSTAWPSRDHSVNVRNAVFGCSVAYGHQAAKALLMVFHITNKDLAHIAADLTAHPAHGRLLEIASQGIPAFVISYLYTPLGLAAPNYKITSRLREV